MLLAKKQIWRSVTMPERMVLIGEIVGFYGNEVILCGGYCLSLDTEDALELKQIWIRFTENKLLKIKEP